MALRATAAALTLLFAWGAQAQQLSIVPENASWYPLQVGNKWHYRVVPTKKPGVKETSSTDAGMKVTIRVDKAVQIKFMKDAKTEVEVPAFRLVGVTEERVAGRPPALRQLVEHVAVLADGVHRFAGGDKDPTPPLRILKFPVTVGDSWECNVPLESGAVKGTFTIREADIPIPPGTSHLFRKSDVNKNGTVKTMHVAGPEFMVGAGNVHRLLVRGRCGHRQAADQTGHVRCRSGTGKVRAGQVVLPPSKRSFTMATAEWPAWVKQAEKLFDQKKFDEAFTLAQQALKIVPDNGPALQVEGLVYSERGRYWEAIDRLGKALRQQPDLVPSHNGLGRCYFLLGKLERALTHLETALRLQPDHGFAHFNRSMSLLKLGRYREGWLEYEWRWNCKLIARPEIPRPRWDGSPLQGRSILIHTEQGLGDVLQFVRFLPQLKLQGGRVVLACQKALHKLLKPLPFVDEWFPIDEPGTINFEVYCPLLSLPGMLGVDEASIPRDVPYIFADEARKQRWQPRIRSLPGFKVGIAWQGSPTFHGDELRSIPLSQFESLAGVEGVSLVSLQKGHGIEQAELNRERVPLTLFPELDQDGAFVDSAAIVHYLDLIITSDSAVAHLAGSLGRPVWVLLGVSCDWRWQSERSDSPWYPTMRLFRQQTMGDWAGVFREVAEALRAETARRTAKGAILVPVSAGELLDKIADLEIKLERLADDRQRQTAVAELKALQDIRLESMAAFGLTEKFAADLKKVRRQLTEIDNEILVCEKTGDFGERLIELARTMSRLNQQRSDLLALINHSCSAPTLQVN